jgi:AraC-like DNA-binding protein
MSDFIHERVVTSESIPARCIYFSTSNAIVVNHWHDSLELIYLVDGRMSVGVDSKIYALAGGDLLLINSGRLHFTQVRDTPTTVCTLQIPYPVLKAHIPNLDYVRFQDPERDGLLTGSARYGELREHMLALGRLTREKGTGYSLRFNSVLYQLIYVLLLHYGREINSATKRRDDWNNARIERVIAYVKAHYTQPITLRDGAGILSLNPEYFCRFFKRHFGMSFMEYVNSVRLSHVHDALLTTGLTVTELLENNGFTNYRTFIKLFRAAYGATPTALRKRESRK